MFLISLLFIFLDKPLYADGSHLIFHAGALPYSVTNNEAANSFNKLGYALSVTYTSIDMDDALGVDFLQQGAATSGSVSYKIWLKGRPFVMPPETVSEEGSAATESVTESGEPVAKPALLHWALYFESGLAYYKHNELKSAPDTAQGIGIKPSVGVEYPVRRKFFVGARVSYLHELGGPVNPVISELRIGYPL